jgi:hypothetical protein
MMRVDRAPVASKRGVPLRSASFFVNELTGADDDLMVECLCHHGGLWIRGLLRPYELGGLAEQAVSPAARLLVG